MPQTPSFFKEMATSFFNVSNAVSTGLKPHSSGALGKATWSIFHPMWKRQEEKPYRAAVLKAKAGKQKLVLMLLKASSLDILVQCFPKISVYM